MIQKPVTMAYEELQQELVQAINRSGVPAILLVPILRDLTRQAESAYNADKQKDEESYRRALALEGESDGG